VDAQGHLTPAPAGVPHAVGYSVRPMKRILRAVALSTVAALSLMRAAPAGRAAAGHAIVAPPAVGQPAPDFRLVDQNGKRVVLSALRGEKVVLVFYRGFW
jgi:cytochrome oxidase Cu insertion factor (SCO1/SenC/PrrC family)